MDFSLLLAQVNSAVANMKAAAEKLVAADNSTLFKELESVKAERDALVADRDASQAQVNEMVNALSTANDAIDLVLEPKVEEPVVVG